jgi:hypothetical protein
LANTVKVDFDAAKLKVKHRRNPFYALDHAGRDGRKKQFGGIKGVWPAFTSYSSIFAIPASASLQRFAMGYLLE